MQHRTKEKDETLKILDACAEEDVCDACTNETQTLEWCIGCKTKHNGSLYSHEEANLSLAEQKWGTLFFS